MFYFINYFFDICNDRLAVPVKLYRPSAVTKLHDTSSVYYRHAFSSFVIVAY